VESSFDSEPEGSYWRTNAGWTDSTSPQPGTIPAGPWDTDGFGEPCSNAPLSDGLLADHGRSDNSGKAGGRSPRASAVGYPRAFLPHGVKEGRGPTRPGRRPRPKATERRYEGSPAAAPPWRRNVRRIGARRGRYLIVVAGDPQGRSTTPACACVRSARCPPPLRERSRRAGPPRFITNVPGGRFGRPPPPHQAGFPRRWGCGYGPARGGTFFEGPVPVEIAHPLAARDQSASFEQKRRPKFQSRARPAPHRGQISAHAISREPI